MLLVVSFQIIVIFCKKKSKNIRTELLYKNIHINVILIYNIYIKNIYTFECKNIYLDIFKKKRRKK